MKKTILISYYIKLFEEGIYFVPEKLIADKAMLGAMSMRRAGVDFKFHDLRIVQSTIFVSLVMITLESKKYLDTKPTLPSRDII